MREGKPLPAQRSSFPPQRDSLSSRYRDESSNPIINHETTVSYRHVQSVQEKKKTKVVDLIPFVQVFLQLQVLSVLGIDFY